jgi:hypothetical protein
MGDGNAGVGGNGDGGGDARHDAEGDARRDQGLRFFAAAAEDEGVAALEPDDAFALACFGDEQVVYLLLLTAVAAGGLSDGDAFGVRRREIEEARVGQPVVDDDVSVREALAARR